MEDQRGIITIDIISLIIYMIITEKHGKTIDVIFIDAKKYDGRKDIHWGLNPENIPKYAHDLIVWNIQVGHPDFLFLKVFRFLKYVVHWTKNRTKEYTKIIPYTATMYVTK